MERGKVNASIYNCYRITDALGVSFSQLISPYLDKGSEEMENEIAVLIGLIREIGKKEQKIILSALRGMLSAIKKNLKSASAISS